MSGRTFGGTFCVLSSQEIEEENMRCDIGSITNTDEVALLYRSFPSLAIRDRTDPSTYKRVKDRLTAVLTVFADGRKAPLTIIGKTKRTRSFPRHLDPAKVLGIFYLSQRNEWNTQALWTTIARGLDNSARLQNLRVINVLDNCSSHEVDYSPFRNWEAVFLPPNMTSVLQPVDAAIGRSFKCAFRRLLVDHILKFVDTAMRLPEEYRAVFELTAAVSTYDAVVMMKKAWDLVPVRVVLNG